MTKLSTEAKAMMLGAFLSPKTKITFQNVKSVPSPQARRGLTDLMGLGLVQRDMDGIAETFSLTDAGVAFDRRTIAKDPFKWMAEHGRFPMAVPAPTPQGDEPGRRE